MEATALVLFREVLEIAIILSVIAAATVGMPNRGRWILAGIGIGIFGASIIALFTESIASSFDDRGQEIMNACILLAAAAMIGWTVVWMKRHAREMTQHMRKVGKDVIEGKSHARVLAGVIALAVFREGSEIVLFCYGLLAGGTPLVEFAKGAAIGLGGGAVLGWLMYIGLLKISTKYIFGISGWLLAFVSAGLAAKGVSFLVAADMLPIIHASVWDSSAYLSNGSTLGSTLSVLIGYDANPNAMQLIAYLLVLGLLITLLKLSNKPKLVATTA